MKDVIEDVAAFAAKINKQFGANVLMPATQLPDYGMITSGSLALDVILGGGWKVGQWHEIIGRESHGKTVVALKTIAANQQINPDFRALWVASEDYDEKRAETLGVDNSRVHVLAINDMEQAYTVMINACESGLFDAIVLDSYPALIPRVEEEQSMDEVQVAAGARATSKFFRKVGPAMRRKLEGDDRRPVTGFFINQYRENIGAFSPTGVALTTPGGNAKRYAVCTILEVRRDEFIIESREGGGKEFVGMVIKAKTVKSKTAPPQQVATIHFYFSDAPSRGIKAGEYDFSQECLTYAVWFKIIERRGAYYYYGDSKWQGQENTLNAIRNSPELREELHEKILAAAKKSPDERETLSA